MSKDVPLQPGTVYTTADLLRLTSATKGNLIHWSAIQLIRPDVEDATGSGHHKRYSALNVMEVEIAAQLNKYKIPTALIADGIDAFRLFHEQCVALWTAGPLDEGDHWTPAQRRAYVRAMVRAARRRGIPAGAEGIKPVSFSARALQDPAFTDAVQRETLQIAARWRRVLRERDYLATHFFGLFVNPHEDLTQVADEPFELHDLMTYAVVVVNLCAVLAELQADGVEL